MNNLKPLDSDPTKIAVSRALTDGAAAETAAETISKRLETYSTQARGAFSAHTERAIASDTRHWSEWCISRGLTPLPADPSALSAYIDAQASDGLRPATIRRRLTSLSHQHRAAGLPSPAADNQVHLALRRLGRDHCSRQEQAAPLGHAEVEAIIRTTGQALIDHRDIALLLVARDGLLRRSELVALQCDDIEGQDDRSATLLVRRSKTDRVGAGAIVYLSPRTMVALTEWVTHAGISTGHLFRSIDQRRRISDLPLCPDDVSRIFKKAAARAGLDATHISGHSARIGMAQDLAASGTELAQLQLAGRWKNPSMPARYAERLAVGRGAVAQFYQKLQRVMTEG